MSTLSSLRKFRRALRRTEVLTGHAVAIGAGRILPRIVNVLLGRLIGRASSRVWR